MTKYRRSLRCTALLVLTPTLVVGTLQSGGPARAKPAQVPDLRVSTTKMSAFEVQPGESLVVTTSIANAGKAKAKAVKVHYYLSTDKAVGKDIKFAARGKVRPLAPGKKAIVKSKVIVPGSTANGSYYLLACADAKGKDKKSNNCRTSSTRATVSTPWKGTLTGTLTYDKATQSPSTDFPEKSQDHATVDVKINVDESKSGWAVFGNAGSTYAYHGSYDKHSGDDWCTTDIKGTSVGGGPLAQVGNQYEDDIMGDFGTLDHSEINLLIGLRYQKTVTTSQTPVGNGCPAKTSIDGPKSLRNLTQVELHRGVQSGKTVTYRIHQVLDPYGTKTDWNTVTGTLTLQLE